MDTSAACAPQIKLRLGQPRVQQQIALEMRPSF